MTNIPSSSKGSEMKRSRSAPLSGQHNKEPEVSDVGATAVAKIRDALEQILFSAECLERERTTGVSVAIELYNIPRELEKISPEFENADQALRQGQFLLAQQRIDADNVNQCLDRLAMINKTSGKKKQADEQQSSDQREAGPDRQDKLAMEFELLNSTWRKDLRKNIDKMCAPPKCTQIKVEGMEEIGCIFMDMAAKIEERMQTSFIVDPELEFWRQFCDKCKSEPKWWQQECPQTLVLMRICLSPFLRDVAERENPLMLMLRGIAKYTRFSLMVMSGVGWDEIWQTVFNKPDEIKNESECERVQQLIKDENGNIHLWDRIRCFPDTVRDEDKKETKDFPGAYLCENADDLAKIMSDNGVGELDEDMEDEGSDFESQIVILLKRKMENWIIIPNEDTSGSDKGHEAALRRFYEKIERQDSTFPVEKAFWYLMCMNFRQAANNLGLALDDMLSKNGAVPQDVEMIFEVLLVLYMRISPRMLRHDSLHETDLGEMGEFISRNLPESMAERVMDYLPQHVVYKNAVANGDKTPEFKYLLPDSDHDFLNDVVRAAGEKYGPVEVLRLMFRARYSKINIDDGILKMIDFMSFEEKIEALEILLGPEADQASHSNGISELAMSVLPVFDRLSLSDRRRLCRLLTADEGCINANEYPALPVWIGTAQILVQFDRGSTEEGLRLYEEATYEHGHARHVIPHTDEEIGELIKVLDNTLYGSTLLSTVTVLCIAALLKQQDKAQRIQVLIKLMAKLQQQGAKFTACYLSKDDQERLAWIQRLARDEK